MQTKEGVGFSFVDRSEIRRLQWATVAIPTVARTKFIPSRYLEGTVYVGCGRPTGTAAGRRVREPLTSG